MVVPYANFGREDDSLYRFYLLASCLSGTAGSSVGRDVDGYEEGGEGRSLRLGCGCDVCGAGVVCIAPLVSSLANDGCFLRLGAGDPGVARTGPKGTGLLSCGSSLDYEEKSEVGNVGGVVDSVDSDGAGGISSGQGQSIPVASGINASGLASRCRQRKVGPNGGVSVGRGINYERNQQRRDRKKIKSRGVVGPAETFKGVFADCSLEIRKELVDSRASMLIAENKARKAKADSFIRHSDMVKQSRVNETKFELGRQSAEEKLKAISERRLGAGFVEGTLVSSAATPSLSSGSVSPNSSISMAEVKRKDNLILDLERKLSEVTLKLSSVGKEKDELKKDKVARDHKLARENHKKKEAEKAKENDRRLKDQLQLQVQEAKIRAMHLTDGYSKWD